MRVRVAHHLRRLYPDADVESLTDDVLRAIGIDPRRVVRAGPRSWGPDDVVLITYADTFRAADRRPLQTLLDVLDHRLGELVSIVHVLPFWPSSSDAGFSVVDYETVDPRLGTWEDVEAIAARFGLMVDVVLNHVSASSEWFRQFLAGRPPGAGYFVTSDPDADLGAVVRPRTSPLLRRVDTAAGSRHVWCTFGPDQVDVDFSNPAVLCEYLRIIDRYLRHGARVLRLDAIAYVWKRPGSRCIHLPETHELVKLLRTLVELRQPDAVLVTETNVPGEENRSYFGAGDEAHAVYNFSLPPLLVDALLHGDQAPLSAWLAACPPPPTGAVMLNMIATHDGIGVRPAEGLLGDDRIEALAAAADASGGGWSPYTAVGGPRPYELNVSLYDLLARTAAGPDARGRARYACAHTVMAALAGVPAFYVHSLLATPSAHGLVAATGERRSINRAHLDAGTVCAALDDPRSVSGRVFRDLAAVLRVRRMQPAFAPGADQEVVDLGPGIVALRRTPDGSAPVLALHNVTDREQAVSLERSAHDLLSGGAPVGRRVALAPYQCRWLV